MPGWGTRIRWSAFTAWHLRHESSLPFWPLERVLAVQARRIRQIAAFAAREVPFYREAFRSAGLRPKECRSAADLARLPLLRKEEVSRHPERFRPERLNRASLRLHSSGTSGKARTIDYDDRALFLALAHGYRQRLVLARVLGRTTGYREAVIARPEGLPVQIRRFYETHSWFPSRVELERIIISPAESYTQIFRRLEEFQPDAVFGYGSHLGAFYRWMAGNNTGGHLPRVIFYGADRMPDADRTLIEEKLGIPVFSFYQSAESLRIAFQCERRQGLHLSLDQIAVRVIDSSGHDAPPGGRGEIVISNLTNRATVLLNYSLGDIVTVASGPCPCGRSLPIIDRIEGRADDLVRLPDGSSIHALSALEGVQAVPGVIQVQIVQEELRKFLLRAVCSPEADWPVIEKRFASVLSSTLGDGLTLQIERVPEIAPDSSGKVRAVVSRITGLSSR